MEKIDIRSLVESATPVSMIVKAVLEEKHVEVNEPVTESDQFNEEQSLQN